jgi:hypothetical protein
MEASISVRYHKTRDFLEEHIGKSKQILDLGVPSAFSKALDNDGFKIRNTAGEDLDVHFAKFIDTGADVVTAFEVFEHLLAPFNLLRSLKTSELVASVPLNLWFSKGYWNYKEPWDCHYHEFHKRQLDMLLDRTGWEIVARESWPHHAGGKIGFRPFLRRFVDRYYLVYCRRKPGYQIPPPFINP